MPSFAIGIIHRLENQMEASQAAIERAFERLNPSSTSFAVVANNLAWLLANDAQPDLERALRLSQLAVQRHPNSGGLRDTLATVLMKQKRYDIALVEFQRALPTIKDKSAVHLKMAKIYDELQQPQLATLHRNRASVN